MVMFNNLEQIDDFDAAQIASAWHSVITWSDPGVAMYSVTSTGKVHNEKHRADLLAYIASCMPQAARADDAGYPPVFPGMFDSNAEELEALRIWTVAYEIEAQDLHT